MQTVKRFECNGKSAIVRFDVDWQEYVVQFYSNGVHMDASDYHTEYRDDAFDTAQYAIQNERNWTEMASIGETQDIWLETKDILTWA